MYFGKIYVNLFGLQKKPYKLTIPFWVQKKKPKKF